MPKYLVHYHSCELQTDEVTADSPKAARDIMLRALGDDYDAMSKPDDWTYGVDWVDEVEEELEDVV